MLVYLRTPSEWKLIVAISYRLILLLRFNYPCTDQIDIGKDKVYCWEKPAGQKLVTNDLTK